MTLGQYLTQKGLTREAFGRLIGVSGQSVSRYLTGARTPSKRAMLRIIKATEGDVRADSFFSDHLNRAA